MALFREMCDARWATWIRMLGANSAARYLLLHLTNHSAGRDLMKECLWKICPDGEFYARKSEDPAQELLITPEPSLEPLRLWIEDRLKGRPHRWSELSEALHDTLWRQTHLNKLIGEMRRAGAIEARAYEGRFSKKADPVLALVKRSY